MEGKTVILSVLIMTLVMAQIQVEAKYCCPSTTARHVFDKCRARLQPRQTCVSLSGCKFFDSTCPPGYDKVNGILENSGVSVNEFCKMGCASSVCDALISLSNSDASEIVNGAVEKCNNACSTFCNKGSPSAGVEAA